jgi:transposase-like protein
MKKSARRENRSQEATTQQLVFAAMRDTRATLHEAVMHAGMTVLGAMLEEERTKLCGPRYAHDAGRGATRAGYANGELALGGRRVSLRRPRVRSVDGAEVPLAVWERFASADPLTPRAVEQMVLGVSTRKYVRSLETVPPGIEARGTSKSAVSRRFVEATGRQLDAMMSRDLSGLALCTVMIDGIHVGEHVVLIALGIDEHGEKHVLGLHEGATENTTACVALLSDLVARGVKSDRTMLFVIDGSKALASATRKVFGKRALVQRCQVHKRRNVEDHLPEARKSDVGRAIATAYRSTDPARAKRMLEGLAKQLERAHPSAAASLREGLDETLTVMRCGLTDWLTRTLATTNPIEFINGRIRETTHNVKRWESGTMVLRWLAVALDEASKTFRKLRGYKGMPKLVEALRAHDAQLNSTSIDTRNKAA